MSPSLERLILFKDRDSMFKDEVVIFVSSGSGGDGCVSFRREKFIPKGGPDGGDGGKGGDVVFVVDPDLASLGTYHNQQKFHAQNGKPGHGACCTGKSGKDLNLRVPKGTLIRDGQHGHVLKDLSDLSEPFIFLQGGKGGRGNARFASALDQVPRRAEKGRPGEGREIILELKMIADVGIVGLPNAGKSTLLSRVSKATPQIADYPFTTLVPQLGVVEIDFHRIIFADIPGLIEGAHMGQGLGDRFLRHIERTRLLLHLIDCEVGKREGFKHAFTIVHQEMEKYSPVLARKRQLVALTKADLLVESLDLEQAASDLGFPVHLISSHTGSGLNHLLGAVVRELGLQN
jgi:GTP-binding protein